MTERQISLSPSMIQALNTFYAAQSGLTAHREAFREAITALSFAGDLLRSDRSNPTYTALFHATQAHYATRLAQLQAFRERNKEVLG